MHFGFRKRDTTDFRDVYASILNVKPLPRITPIKYKHKTYGHIQFYNEKLAACDPSKAQKDPKTQLQEILQAEASALPVYTVLKTGGEAHNQTFEVECFIQERNIKQTGTGTSRRKAEQAAASKVLEMISNE